MRLGFTYAVSSSSIRPMPLLTDIGLKAESWMAKRLLLELFFLIFSSRSFLNFSSSFYLRIAALSGIIGIKGIFEIWAGFFNGLILVEVSGDLLYA
jgi:hypothetical protein